MLDFVGERFAVFVRLMAARNSDWLPPMSQRASFRRYQLGQFDIRKHLCIYQAEKGLPGNQDWVRASRCC